MKINLVFFFLLPLIALSQVDERYWNRELIDSIHTKRLCIEYPGLTREQTTKEALDESILVFTGKVIEIIRIEKMDEFYIKPPPPPPPITKADSLRHEDYLLGKIDPIEPVQQYYYVFETDEVFKGKKEDTFKVYSRIFDTISPLLMLNKSYLIYAVEGEIQELPYIYCNGNSRHIKYAERDIKELRALTKN